MCGGCEDPSGPAVRALSAEVEAVCGLLACVECLWVFVNPAGRAECVGRPSAESVEEEDKCQVMKMISNGST